MPSRDSGRGKSSNGVLFNLTIITLGKSKLVLITFNLLSLTVATGLPTCDVFFQSLGSIQADARAILDKYSILIKRSFIRENRAINRRLQAKYGKN